jgi:signal transduction histidine kinase
MTDSPRGSLNKTKILIVDDLDENLVALKALLKSISADESLEIHSAISGVQALNLLLDQDFALALIDVQMPGMDGFELAELMRGKEKTKNVPIIFVTAGAQDAKHTFKGYETGAVDFLYKPLDARIVKSKVRVFIELDQQRRMLQKQLAQTVVNEQELQKALLIRDEFLGIASHELRTPLTSLKLHLQMVARSVRKEGLASISVERFEKMIHISNKQVDVLTHLIEDLMDVSRITHGKMVLDPEAVDIVALTQEVLEYFSENLLSSGCQIQLDAPDSLVEVIDRQRTQQVIVNLISNAIKYGPHAPIEVKVWQEEKTLSFSVKDHGTGIAEKDKERIFERFERAVESQNAVSGLGLGLFIVKQIVTAQGGTIEVESEVRKGSTFTVKIPC